MKNTITSKRENMTFSQKNKKAQSINILNTVKKITERVKTKKKSDGDISFHYSFKKGKFLCEPKILNKFFVNYLL